MPEVGARYHEQETLLNERKQQGEEVDLSSLGSPHIQVWVALARELAMKGARRWM